MVIFDGQKWATEADVPDLGSLECTSYEGTVRNYQGMSIDADKLPHYVGEGSSCLMLDTADLWMYHKKTDTWLKVGG